MSNNSKPSAGKVIFSIIAVLAALAAAYMIFIRVAASLAKDADSERFAKLKAKMRAKKRPESETDDTIADYRDEDDDKVVDGEDYFDESFVFDVSLDPTDDQPVEQDDESGDSSDDSAEAGDAADGELSEDSLDQLLDS